MWIQTFACNHTTYIIEGVCVWGGNACMHVCACACACVHVCVCMPMCANMNLKHVWPSHNMASSGKTDWAEVWMLYLRESLSQPPRLDSQPLFLISVTNTTNVNICSFWMLRPWVFGYSP